VTDILGRECFFEETASLGNAAAEIDRLVADTTTKLTRQQTDLAQEELSRWQASADWSDLKEDEKVWFSEEINRLAILVAPDLDGLKKLLSHDFSLNHRLRDLSAQLGRKAAAHRDSAHKVEVDSDPDPAPTTNEPPPKKPYATTTEVIVVPKVFTSADQIDLLVAELKKLRHRVSPAEHLRITWKEMGTE